MRKTKGLQVKKNKDGSGVFALRPYAAGEVICVLKGTKTTPRTLYYHGHGFKNATINPLQIENELYLDLARPYIFINHSCDPNAGMRRTSTLFALKTIRPGDEITYDYSTTIDESFRCRCGSTRCRKVIIDFFGLPRQMQEYFFKRKALPQFILKKYRRWRKEK